MRRFRDILSVALCSLALSASADAQETQAQSPAVKTSSHILGPVHVREKYISMTGPVVQGSATLEGPVWVTGFRVDVLNDKGESESPEYLCHAWVTLGNRFALADQKMMTISEGLEEMTFPPGFAIRLENAPNNIALLAQALNNNEKVDKKLSYKLTVSYVDDNAAKEQGLRNLRTISVAVMAKDANPSGSSEICRTQDETAGVSMTEGGKSLVHFDVPPGRHEYKSVIPKDSPLYAGGTIHFIKLHLHPYGESITLTDKTTGETLWAGKAQMAADGRAVLTDTDHYASAEGLKIDTSHEYEISSVYNNTTDKVTDAMAVLRLYVADAEKEGAQP